MSAHKNPRNRARQSAARELAAADGITYQQALARLNRSFSVLLRLSLSDATFQAPARVLQAALDRAEVLLAGRGALAGVDCFRDAYGGLAGVALLTVAAANAEKAREQATRLADILHLLPHVDEATVDAYVEPVEGQVNTALTFLYRDEHNYKALSTVVLCGAPRLGDLDIIRGKLEAGELFIPSQVGLDDIQWKLQSFDSPETSAEYDADPDASPDHVWHELGLGFGDGLTLTSAEPTDGDFADLVQAFAAVEWDVTAPFR